MRHMFRLGPCVALLVISCSGLSAQTTPESLSGMWRGPDRITSDDQYYRVTKLEDAVFCEVFPAGMLVWNAKRTGSYSWEWAAAARALTTR